jgi:hypothetical protein
MSQYTAATAPDLDPAYKTFFEAFYRQSDLHPSDGGTAEKLAENLTEDGTLVMGAKRAEGRQGACFFFLCPSWA